MSYMSAVAGPVAGRSEPVSNQFAAPGSERIQQPSSRPAAASPPGPDPQSMTDQFLPSHFTDALRQAGISLDQVSWSSEAVLDFSLRLHQQQYTARVDGSLNLRMSTMQLSVSAELRQGVAAFTDSTGRQGMVAYQELYMEMTFTSLEISVGNGLHAGSGASREAGALGPGGESSFLNNFSGWLLDVLGHVNHVARQTGQHDVVLTFESTDALRASGFANSKVSRPLMDLLGMVSLVSRLAYPGDAPANKHMLRTGYQPGTGTQPHSGANLSLRLEHRSWEFQLSSLWVTFVSNQNGGSGVADSKSDNGSQEKGSVHSGRQAKSKGGNGGPKPPDGPGPQPRRPIPPHADTAGNRRPEIADVGRTRPVGNRVAPT